MPEVHGLPTGLVDGPGARLYVAQVGSGRPPVFLHGLGWDHTLWGPEFSRYGVTYHVIAGDTRGHGRSDKPPGPYTIPLFTADRLVVFGALGVDPACVVGFSQGGMIAMLFESIFSPRFRTSRSDLVTQFVRWRAGIVQEPLFDATRAASAFDVCTRPNALRMPCLVVAGNTTR